MPKLETLILNALKNVTPRERQQILTPEPGTTVDVQYYAPVDDIEDDGGEIVIRFTRPHKRAKVTSIGGGPVRPPVTGAQDREDEGAGDRAFIVAALKDAAAKNSFPFVSLRWFKQRYLPALGTNFTPDEIDAIVMQLVARGEFILEKVPNPNPPYFEVTAVRTPDMPAAQNNIV